ncbi:WD40-repeat-containing domain protein [Cladochytrium replicatum]|nr:WD40-repeat-containing domain protein [Cladochytrium replicatum]
MSLVVPFHTLAVHTQSRRIFAVFRNKFIALDTETAECRVSYEGHSLVGETTIPLNAFPATTIRGITFDNTGEKMVIARDDKVLACWSTSDWKVIATRSAPKRVNAMIFPEDDAVMILADKFGDVYRHDFDNPTSKERLLLGHVSMITDMVLTQDRKFVITSDRDEKIRVSKYPFTFSILTFCLGHKEFVSSLNIPDFAPDRLISGGGDPFILVWNWKQGRRVQSLPLKELIGSEHPAPYTVLSIKSHSKNSLVAIIFEKLSVMLILKPSKVVAGEFELSQKIQLNHHPLAIEFDHDGKLWVAYGPREERQNGSLLDVLETPDGGHELERVARLRGALSKIVTESVSELGTYYHGDEWRKGVVPARHPRKEKQKRIQRRKKGKKERMADKLKQQVRERDGGEDDEDHEDDGIEEDGESEKKRRERSEDQVRGGEEDGAKKVKTGRNIVAI